MAHPEHHVFCGLNDSIFLEIRISSVATMDVALVQFPVELLKVILVVNLDSLNLMTIIIKSAVLNSIVPINLGIIN